MKNLDIKKKFQLLPEKIFQSQESAFNIIPYSKAINELNQLSQCKSPREKLDCITMMNSQMRSDILQFHDMTVELESMDDELPITIYILGYTEVKDMISNLNYIRNYIELHDAMDAEEKIITHLIASTDYIMNNWNINQISDS